MKTKDAHLSIPGVGPVRLRRHGGNPYPEGKPVKASVVHECGKWYATVCYKVELPPRADPERVAAMDRTCGQVAVVYSDGTHDLHGRPDTTLLQIKLSVHRASWQGRRRAPTVATEPSSDSGSCTGASGLPPTPGGIA